MPGTDQIFINKDIFDRTSAAEKYSYVRNFTEQLCRPLEKEDYVIQSMPDVSPAKWHLAHTTWFFEAFILSDAIPGYKPYNQEYFYLFNSYYINMGERFPRPYRGLLSRPTVDDIFNFRRAVDERILTFISSASQDQFRKYSPLLAIGFNHEQQHQELIITDIKHVLSCNPLYPVYNFTEGRIRENIAPTEWHYVKEGLYSIGAEEADFSYDNERPAHWYYLKPFNIASRLVTNAEFIDFIEEGGYSNPVLWLSEGYGVCEKEKWNAPLYWIKENDGWYYFTLSGLQKVNPNEPVCHVSYYEADAYARWKGYRLPSEFEWETAAPDEIAGNFADDKIFHPLPLMNNDKGQHQFYGDVWEWTKSAYLGYPGFKIPPGALGEYNGKFMSGQMVLRGGSCATHSSHIRKTYRNFFPPHSRWQFMGIRLASDGE